MKRRTLALLSATALATAAAAGCSSSSSSPAASASASPGSANFGVNATGTVQFWARTVSKTLAQKLVNEFNASHSNLKVKLTLTSINDDTTSLATSIRAGDPPDVVGLNDIDMPTFTRNGSFLNLTKAIAALPYASALSPGHVGLGTYQGQEYGLPYWADLSVLWYNKQLFTKAGLNPNDPPTTLRPDPVRCPGDQQARATGFTGSPSPATARAASASPCSRASGPREAT